MSLSRCLLSSAVLAGTVFCGTTLPLAAFGSKPVTIQLEEKPVFVGQVEEFAVPYIGLAAAISLAAGVASLATAGWRQSSRKLTQAEAQMSALKQQLSEKEAFIEDIKFSQQRLSTSGLEFFLQEDEAQLPQSTIAASVNAAQSHSTDAEYVVVGAAQPSAAMNSALLTHTAEAQSPETAAIASKQSAVHPTQVQAATALASAQAFMGFSRPAQTETAAPIAPSEDAPQLNELLTHLKQVMVQIERMQVGSDAESAHAGNPAWQQPRLAS